MKTLMRTIAIAALGFFALTAAKADTYMLTKDEDWTNRAQQFPDAVDLNGHNLTVSRLSDACTITDSSEPGSGGELRVKCATNVTKTDATTITGSLTLVKDGAGTFTWNGGTLAATIPILVTNGVFKVGVTTADVFGNSGTITVKGKGQFYIDAKGTANVVNRTFLIEGDGPDGSGAIANDAGGASNLADLRLTGDATIGGGSRIDFRGGTRGVTGPGHTLTIKNTSMVAVCGGQAFIKVKRVVCSDKGVFQPCSDTSVPFDSIPDGVFLKRDGIFAPWCNNANYVIPLKVTVEAGEKGIIRADYRLYKITGAITVGEGATLTLNRNNQTVCTFTDVVNNGTITGDWPGSITGTLSGNGVITATGLALGGDNAGWRVACNDEGLTEIMKLDGAAENFLANLKRIEVLCDGSKVENTYTLAPAKGLTSVDGITLAVTDATSGLPLTASSLAIDENKNLVLSVVRDARPVIAVWTGEADNGRLDDPLNWACTNSAGGAVSGLPCEITDVHLNGEIALQIPAGTTFDVKSITANMTLADACDWSGLAVPVAGKIDLKGHNLTVTQFNGTCEFTDSSEPVSGGELHLSCAADVTKTDATKITGSLTLVKDGNGTLTWNGGTLAATIPILVTNGVFKLGVMTADVFGNSGMITVKDKGQFDLNCGGTSPVRNKTFLIEGDGPDGSGVIVNTILNGGGGWHLKNVTLTGDATIGGRSRIDFRDLDSGVTGPDYTLTVKNTDMVSVCNGQAFMNVRRLVCTDGGVFQPCSNVAHLYNQIPEGVFLKNEGTLALWSNNANYEYPLKVTVEAGEKGIIRADYLRCRISGAITVEEGATLTLNKNGQTPGTLTDVVNNGTITGDWTESITGTLSGNGKITAKGLALGGDNAGWHVACNDEGFTEIMNLGGAAENFLASLKRLDVLCDGSEPTKAYILGPRKGLVSAVGVALSVTDATSGMPLESSTFEINGENQLVVTVDRRDPRPAMAVWTGEAGNGRLDDLGNWACTNAAGKAVSELPCEITDVRLNGEIALQIPAGTTFDVKSITANMTLADACDWSGLAVPVSGKIDLKGHNLTVTQLSGNGEITDSSGNGELHVTVAKDAIVTGNAKLTGTVTLVKDGEGTFTWNGGANSVATTCPVLVTNGVFKVGETTADVFGSSGTITVKGKGQFYIDSVKGTANVVNRTFLIEGDGPDGSGAIANDAGGASNLADLRLTGDATIGGGSRIDFRGGTRGVTGPDHTLTIKNTNMVAICSGQAFINVKRVVCSDRGVFQPCTDTTAPFDSIPEGVFLKRDGIFAPWCNKANYEFPLKVTVEAGETGEIRAEHTQLYKITEAVTVEKGATLKLNRNNKTVGTFADIVNNGTITGDWPGSITGTLSGNGVITATGLAFGGDNSCWRVDIDGKGDIQKVNLDNASANFITNLRKIDVSYVKATGYYYLAPTELTAVDGITLKVTNANTGRELAASRLKIRNGRLGVSIPNGIVILVH